MLMWLFCDCPGRTRSTQEAEELEARCEGCVLVLIRCPGLGCALLACWLARCELRRRDWGECGVGCANAVGGEGKRVGDGGARLPARTHGSGIVSLLDDEQQPTARRRRTHTRCSPLAARTTLRPVNVHFSLPGLPLPLFTSTTRVPFHLLLMFHFVKC